MHTDERGLFSCADEQGQKDFIKSLLALAAVLFLVGYGCETITAGRFVMDGDSFLKKAQYDEAISEYTKALEVDPQYSDAYRGRGRSYMHKKKYDKAIEDLSRAVEIDPMDMQAQYSRGAAYSHMGRFDEAILDFTKLITRLETSPPKVITGHRTEIGARGRSYATWGSFTYNEPYEARAYCYSKKNEYDKALQDLERATQIDHNASYAYRLRGQLLRQLGQRERSCADLKRACELGHCQEYEAAKKALYCN